MGSEVEELQQGGDFKEECFRGEDEESSEGRFEEGDSRGSSGDRYRRDLEEGSFWRDRSVGCVILRKSSGEISKREASARDGSVGCALKEIFKRGKFQRGTLQRGTGVLGVGLQGLGLPWPQATVYVTTVCVGREGDVHSSYEPG